MSLRYPGDMPERRLDPPEGDDGERCTCGHRGECGECEHERYLAGMAAWGGDDEPA